MERGHECDLLIQVPLATAAVSVYTPSGPLVIGHASVPAIVLTDGLEDVTTVCLDNIREIRGSSPDVVPYIQTITVRRVGTLVLFVVGEPLRLERGGVGLTGLICIIPASPPCPMVLGLQLDSWSANAAINRGGTLTKRQE